MISVNVVDIETTDVNQCEGFDNLHFELRNGRLYLYKNYFDLVDDCTLEDCTIKLMINGKTILCEVVDGYLQNFSTVVE